jgi:hypothetical protein
VIYNFCCVGLSLPSLNVFLGNLIFDAIVNDVAYNSLFLLYILFVSQIIMHSQRIQCNVEHRCVRNISEFFSLSNILISLFSYTAVTPIISIMSMCPNDRQHYKLSVSFDFHDACESTHSMTTI